MKTSYVKILIVIISILSAISVKAQDYVITAKGDSIPCKITRPLLASFRYKSADMADAVKIKPEEIKTFYSAKRKALYHSVVRDSSDRVFMLVVEDGPISLYQYVYTNYNGTITTTTTVWYVGKNSDIVMELKTTGLFLGTGKKARKDALGEMLLDKKELYDKYKAEDKFSFAQIRNIVHLYNTGKPFAQLEKTKKEDSSNDFNPSQN